MKIKLLLLMSFTLSLTSSSFFLPPYLANLLVSAQFAQSQLDFALDYGVEQAFLYQHKKLRYGSKLWLKNAKSLAMTQGSTAFELAQYYRQQAEIVQEKFWYRQAIRLHYQGGYIELAKLYIEEGELIKAKQLLSVILPNEQALLLSSELAVALNDRDFFHRYKKQLISSLDGSNLFNQLIKFQIIDQSSQPDSVDSLVSTALCPASIQLFATSLVDLQKAESWIAQFKQHAMAPYVCFSAVR